MRVSVCVSLLLLATTCKSQIMTHTPTWGITKKGAGRRTGRKKKKTNLALAFCTFKKFKQCVSVFLEKLFVHWWRIHLHTHKHTHTRTLCALAASLEIQTETSFSHFIPYALHIHAYTINTSIDGTDPTHTHTHTQALHNFYHFRFISFMSLLLFNFCLPTTCGFLKVFPF